MNKIVIREALFEQGVPIVDEYGVTCRAAKTKAEQALQKLSDFHQYMEATEPEYYDCGGTIGVVHKSQCSAAMKRNGKPWKCACGANLYIDGNGAPASKAEPVQEPVSEHDLHDVRCECCGYMTHHREHMGCIRAAYAAPVSTEAIRAEALEQAAKVCRTAQAKGLQSIREAIEAAIRGLK